MEGVDLVVTNVQKSGGASGLTLAHLAQFAGSFDLVIVDEAHHFPAITWRAIIDTFAHSKRIFLTATAITREGYILGAAIGRDPEIPRAFELTRADALARGIIRHSDKD